MKTTRRRKIILAAVTEFAEKGFDGASMEAVALKAGVAKGTVFYHFKTKSDLFGEIIMEGRKILEQEIIKETNLVQTYKEKIEKIVEMEVNFINRYRDLFIVYLSDAAKKPISSKVFRSILIAGVKSGELRKDLNVETLEMSLFWTTAMVSLNLKDIKTEEIKKVVLNGIIG
jgi:AcrR family transcriptional regulator